MHYMCPRKLCVQGRCRTHPYVNTLFDMALSNQKFYSRPAAEKTPSLRGETPLRSVNYKAPSNINCSTLGPLDTPPSRRHAVQPTPILKKKVFDDI